MFDFLDDVVDAGVSIVGGGLAGEAARRVTKEVTGSDALAIAADLGVSIAVGSEILDLLSDDDD